jgi:hypothetical protein
VESLKEGFGGLRLQNSRRELILYGLSLKSIHFLIFKKKQLIFQNILLFKGFIQKYKKFKGHLQQQQLINNIFKILIRGYLGVLIIKYGKIIYQRMKKQRKGLHKLLIKSE